jgi:hypothetical protein
LELAAQLAELIDAQAPAPVLNEKVIAGGGAEARDRGDVEREDHGLGNAGELPLQPRHDARRVESVAVPLLPGMEPDEDRTEVGLVGAGDDAVASDRLVRPGALGLRNDLLDLAQDGAGALE